VRTMTVSPGLATGVVATVAARGSGLTPLADTAKQAQVSSPAPAIQSILNNGMTSVANNLGAGVTNTIGNAVNNQLIQRVITANIGTTGLSQTIQQNVASTVAAGSCCVLAISVTLRRWPMSLNGRPAELHEMKS
jgi:hypothetical protein